MAAPKTKTTLMAKLGDKLKKAHEAHKDDDTTFSGAGNLPAGIENGVAQLVECKFDTYTKGDNIGEFFFYAAGVVVSPRDYTDPKTGVTTRIEGLRTSIMEPLHDTPTRTRKTVEEHLAWIYNELRKLGVETATLEPGDLEATVAALKEASPTFSFRTWKGEPQKIGPYAGKDPITNHQWGGLAAVAETSQDVTDEDLVDNTPEIKTPTKPTQTPVKSPTPPTVKGKRPAPAPEPEPAAEEADEFQDLASLVVKADKGLESAQEALSAAAAQAGYSEEEIDDAANWKVVYNMIQNPKQEETVEDETTPADEEGDTPNVGDVFRYSPMISDKKNPKKKFKGPAIECQVTAVDQKAETVTLKNLDTKVIYKDVPFAELTQDAE